MANDNPLKYMLNENCLSRLTALDYIGLLKWFFITKWQERRVIRWMKKIWANYCMTTLKN